MEITWMIFKMNFSYLDCALSGLSINSERQSGKQGSEKRIVNGNELLGRNSESVSVRRSYLDHVVDVENYSLRSVVVMHASTGHDAAPN